MTFRAIAASALIFGAPLALAPAAHAEDKVYTGFFSDTAVQGHDPVAYFTEGKPVKGSDKFKTDYKAATWKFASQENLDKFLADPEAYAPQYGGYCAWAAAMNKTAKGSADNWAIEDGKLYLNINDDIQEKWAANKAEFIEQADANWPGILE